MNKYKLNTNRLAAIYKSDIIIHMKSKQLQIKKFLIFLLVAILVVSLLGCKKEESANTDEPEETTVSENTDLSEEAKEDPVEALEENTEESPNETEASSPEQSVQPTPAQVTEPDLQPEPEQSDLGRAKEAYNSITEEIEKLKEQLNNTDIQSEIEAIKKAMQEAGNETTALQEQLKALQQEADDLKKQIQKITNGGK